MANQHVTDSKTLGFQTNDNLYDIDTGFNGDTGYGGNSGLIEGNGPKPTEPVGPPVDPTPPSWDPPKDSSSDIHIFDPNPGTGKGDGGFVPPDFGSTTLIGAEISKREANLPVINFLVYTRSNGYLGKCRIELEFYKENMLPRGKNKFIGMIKQDSSKGMYRDSSKYYFNENVNFDDETLNNFTVVVKEWDEHVYDIAYTATECIPAYIADDTEGYSAAIFVSTKDNGIISRNCVGTIDRVSAMIQQ